MGASDFWDATMAAIDYSTKTYGRNAEVNGLFQLFDQGHDVAMPGPRRLGKTFVLERVLDAADQRGWHAVKVDVAGCQDTGSAFREFCEQIGRNLPGGAQLISMLQQRLSQFWSPRSDGTGSWYQDLLTMDHGKWFARLLKGMNEDAGQRWVLLIDELPIFLKALHDRGPEGIIEARAFMNFVSRMREAHPRIRWLITGSIGIEPLARAGNYQGVLAKFHNFNLEPLSEPQSIDFIQDLAQHGQLHHRRTITSAEARALVTEVGWRSAYYLEALARELIGDPSHDPETAARLASQAVERLLQPAQMSTFGTWEEHLRKHYPDPDRTLAFLVLEKLSVDSDPRSVDVLLAALARPEWTHSKVRPLLTRLHIEGFITMSDWAGATPTCGFRNPLLRRWWRRYTPQPIA